MTRGIAPLLIGLSWTISTYNVVAVTSLIDEVGVIDPPIAAFLVLAIAVLVWNTTDTVRLFTRALAKA